MSYSYSFACPLADLDAKLDEERSNQLHQVGHNHDELVRIAAADQAAKAAAEARGEDVSGVLVRTAPPEDQLERDLSVLDAHLAAVGRAVLQIAELHTDPGDRPAPVVHVAVSGHAVEGHGAGTSTSISVHLQHQPDPEA